MLLLEHPALKQNRTLSPPNPNSSITSCSKQANRILTTVCSFGLSIFSIVELGRLQRSARKMKLCKRNVSKLTVFLGKKEYLLRVEKGL